MSRTASRRPVEELLHLSGGALVAWERPRAMHLRVLAGLVWVTRERDLGDHFLHVGECLTLHPRSRTLIQAEREARLIVEPVGSGGSGGSDGSGGARAGRRLAWPRWLRQAPRPTAVALGAP